MNNFYSPSLGANFNISKMAYFETLATSGLSISNAIVVFKKSLFLVCVYALLFKQLLACLSKRLISVIAVYDRTAQRISRLQRLKKKKGTNLGKKRTMKGITTNRVFFFFFRNFFFSVIPSAAFGKQVHVWFVSRDGG